MHKILGIAAAAVIAVTCVAAAKKDSPLLASFAKAIHEAKSLKTDYLVQQLDGPRVNYTLEFQKPNLARIDGPNQTIVADGTDITILDKKANSYYKQPENSGSLASLFASQDLRPWAGFFVDNAYNLPATQELGSVQLGDKTYNAVKGYLNADKSKTVTYYLDPSDNIVRQVVSEAGQGSQKTSSVLHTRSVEVNGSISPTLFTFSAPGDAKEVSLDDMNAGKWYTDLAAAEKAASVSGHKILVDFMATWCGPCHMLDEQVFQTDQFKKMAAERKIILCRIDVDLHPDLAQKYSATAIPLQAVLDANGNVISQTVGFGGPDAFYSFLDKATQ